MEKDFPGGYFHRTHTSLGSRLEHPLVARFNLAARAKPAVLYLKGSDRSGTGFFTDTGVIATGS